MSGDDRLPLTLCWHCDRPLDAATSVEGDDDERPFPGAVSLCLYCGAVAIFGADLRLEAPTDEDLDKLGADPDFRREFVRFQWARQRVMIRNNLMRGPRGPRPMTDPPDAVTATVTVTVAGRVVALDALDGAESFGEIGARHAAICELAGAAGRAWLVDFCFADGEHVRLGTDVDGMVDVVEVGDYGQLVEAILTRYR